MTTRLGIALLVLSAALWQPHVALAQDNQRMAFACTYKSDKVDVDYAITLDMVAKTVTAHHEHHYKTGQSKGRVDAYDHSGQILNVTDKEIRMQILRQLQPIDKTMSPNYFWVLNRKTGLLFENIDGSQRLFHVIAECQSTEK